MDMAPTGWIAIVSAAAAIVNAGSVVVLVVITKHYARSTAELLEESRKAREAAERQASASLLQATAAQSSLDLLRQQLEEQLGLGRGIIQSAIASAISQIEYWKTLPLSDLARASSLPLSGDLLPQAAAAAVEHARRISIAGAQMLSDAFDDLRLAKGEVERAKSVSHAVRTGFFDDQPIKAAAYLESAFIKIQKAQSFLL
jgi:hypothetical protein